ncbi:MAG: ATP-binding protein, partial [Saprospiraceae bacterium]|nr:ATP-binding protein [Saprospiraceae bacterium]
GKNLNHIDYEAIFINDELFLERTTDLTKIKSAKTSNWTEFNPPKDKLVLHIRRDVIDYPYLEEIIAWAENSYGFKFGGINVMPSIQRYLDDDDNNIFLTAVNKDLYLPDLLREIRKENLIENLNKVGYHIEHTRVNRKGRNAEIILKEKGLDRLIRHNELSQGLYRTLFILIYVEYLIQEKQPATIIIDDLCEGLDYERATNLGKLLFEKCLNTNVQLIATSNDSFLMDVIDLKYWNVLQRKGKTVTAINNQNHADLFQKFKFTGLSNFDFFASDFIQQTI